MLEKVTHRSQGSEVAPPGSRLADDEELGTVGSNISIPSLTAREFLNRDDNIHSMESSRRYRELRFSDKAAWVPCQQTR